MQNIKLTLQYDGSTYYGSQIQPHYTTVHGILDQVLKKININTILNFSGRTDSKVHAFKQIVSCKIPLFWSDIQKLKDVLNKMLPNSIYIRSIIKVDDNFHARFSAKQREYRYLISTKPLTTFNANYLGYYKSIDELKINQALKLLKGTYDFKYFSKTGSEPKSTIRTIYDIKLYQYKDIYILKFCANSYLRSQIRILVDFIMKISQGILTFDDLKSQLLCKKKTSSTLASPSGLYLSKIKY